MTKPDLLVVKKPNDRAITIRLLSLGFLNLSIDLIVVF